MTRASYRPSGKFSPIFFLYFLILMIVGAPIISVAYIYLIHYIPWVYANLFVAIGCGALVGLGLVLAARLGKVRSPILVLVFTIIAMVFVKYVQWAVYIPLIFSEVYGFSMTFGERLSEAFYLFRNPDLVLELAVVINEVGVWAIGDGSVVNEGLLTAVWIGEFLLMAGLALSIAHTQPKSPFSEAEGDWYTTMANTLEADMPEDVDGMKRNLNDGSVSDLVQLVKAGRSEDPSFLRVTLFQPPQELSMDPHFMTIDMVMTTGRKQNKQKTKNLVKHMAIELQNVRDLLAAQEAAYRVIEEIEEMDEEAAADQAVVAADVQIEQEELHDEADADDFDDED